jgi:hypothetical protein
MNRKADLNEYLDTLLSHWASYHNHKENMAHLALAAQIAIACAIFSDKWLPYCNHHELFGSFAVIVLWIALYLYAGWEMWFRRKAATIVKAIMRARGKLIDHEPDHSNSTVQINQWGRNFCKCVWWPLFREYDWDSKIYPRELLIELRKASMERDTRLEALEIGSWILSLCLLVAYVLCLFVVK